MKNYLDDVTDKIYELYKTYEVYAWKNEKVKIVISLGENYTLSFYVFQNDEMIDHLQLSFEEENLFKALSLRLFIKTLGNVKIHKLDYNMYFNPVHRKYLLFIVNNSELIKTIDEICASQEEFALNLDMETIKRADKKVKKRKYSKKFLNAIDKRIDVTNEMFRGWGK